MQQHTRRLFLEILEQRTLLSTCHVTRLGDSGGGFGFRGDLRYCINKVNDLPGPDIIDFRVTGKINLAKELARLASDIDIQGPGADKLTIDAQGNGRIFYVERGADVGVSNLTLRGGEARKDQSGGGIYNAGNLVLQACSVFDNTGWGRGGGIYNEGHLTVLDCEISENFLNRSIKNSGSYILGAGIFNSLAATLLLQNVAVNNNETDSGTSFVAMGAGIANLGKARVESSTISGNLASPINSFPYGGAAGGIFNSGELLIDRSLISSNVSTGDLWSSGGGISNGAPNGFKGGTLTVINSTISDNWARVTGGDNYLPPRGGGINSENGGTVVIRHSTIAENRAEGGLPGFGGGISFAGTNVQMQNTILAENIAFNAPDLDGSLSSSGFNLIQTSDGGSGYEPSDILDVDPLLGPLQDNGGPTLTMALLPGSPAIDAGDPNVIDPPEFDQRGPGFPRIVNGTVDIGAFEVQATGAPLPAGARPAYGARRGSPDPAVFITADFETLNLNGRR